jgi:DNA replication protein DnaC
VSQPTFDRIVTHLDRLGLWRIKETLADTLEIAQSQSWGFATLLDRLLEEEIAAREERRIRNSLKLSGLPFVKTLDSFDFAFQPSVDRGPAAGSGLFGLSRP